MKKRLTSLEKMSAEQGRILMGIQYYVYSTTSSYRYFMQAYTQSQVLCTNFEAEWTLFLHNSMINILEFFYYSIKKF